MNLKHKVKDPLKQSCTNAIAQNSSEETTAEAVGGVEKDNKGEKNTVLSSVIGGVGGLFKR